MSDYKWGSGVWSYKKGGRVKKANGGSVDSYDDQDSNRDSGKDDRTLSADKGSLAPHYNRGSGVNRDNVDDNYVRAPAQGERGDSAYKKGGKVKRVGKKMATGGYVEYEDSNRDSAKDIRGLSSDSKKGHSGKFKHGGDVKAMKKLLIEHEKAETPEMEAKESSKTQKMEKKLGLEYKKGVKVTKKR